MCFRKRWQQVTWRQEQDKLCSRKQKRPLCWMWGGWQEMSAYIWRALQFLVKSLDSILNFIRSHWRLLHGSCTFFALWSGMTPTLSLFEIKKESEWWTQKNILIAICQRFELHSFVLSACISCSVYFCFIAESNDEFRGRGSLEKGSWNYIIGIGIKVLIWISSLTFYFHFQWEKWKSVSSSVKRPHLVCFPWKSHIATTRIW